MFFPGFVFRTNLKPLLPKSAFDWDPSALLRDLRKDTLRRIRDGIRKEAFSPRAKARLSASLDIKVGLNSITVVSKDPAFKPLLMGQKKQQMKWLRKAQGPIPIILDSGELIFRTASDKSMQRGGWKHPGRQGTTILERAKKEARAAFKKKLKRILHERMQLMGGR